MSVGWLVRGVGMTWWTHVADTRWSRILDGLLGRWEIHTSLICCQVNWLHLRSAYSTILKISRTQKTVLSSGLFSCVSSFFFQFAAFTILCPFSFPTTFGFCCQRVSWVFLCVRVCLVILGFVFFSFAGSLWVFLSFQSSPPSAMVNQKMVFNPSKAPSLRPA